MRSLFPAPMATDEGGTRRKAEPHDLKSWEYVSTTIAQKQQNGPNADTFLIGAAVIVVPLAAYALVRLIRIANKNKKK